MPSSPGVRYTLRKGSPKKMDNSNNVNALLNTAKECGCDVALNEPLSAHTTFKIGGCCTAMININSAQSLKNLIDIARQQSLRYFVLGKGSNVLFDDKGFDGVIFHIGTGFDELELVGERTVRVQAGCSLMKLCRFALDNSLTGLEFAYGIPGTVGGGVFMNAGAYGGEIKDVLKSCTVVTAEGEIKELEASQLELSYRHSALMQSGDVVCEAVFELEKGDKNDIENKMNELMGRRKEKQPLDYPNAGSTFKRPEGFFAGKLIQDCGLRGFTVGGAKVSDKHCGFVINENNATSSDVVSLIEQVQKIVQKETGQFLECEVRIVPYKVEKR